MPSAYLGKGARHQRQPLLNRPNQCGFGWLWYRRSDSMVQHIPGRTPAFCAPPLMSLRQVETQIDMVVLNHR